VSGLGRRMLNLEGGNANRCPECGLSPNPEANEIEYRVEWEEPHTDEEIAALVSWYERSMPVGEPPAAYREPEPRTPPCPKCGAVREVIIDWDDSPPPHELARIEAKFFAERAWEKAEAEFEAQAEAKAYDVPDYPPYYFEDQGGGGLR
jgi:hypothetical protein